MLADKTRPACPRSFKKLPKLHPDVGKREEKSADRTGAQRTSARAAAGKFSLTTFPRQTSGHAAFYVLYTPRNCTPGSGVIHMASQHALRHARPLTRVYFQLLKEGARAFRIQSRRELHTSSRIYCHELHWKRREMQQNWGISGWRLFLLLLTLTPNACWRICSVRFAASNTKSMHKLPFKIKAYRRFNLKNLMCKKLTSK